jgi:hypothetical protein
MVMSDAWNIFVCICLGLGVLSFAAIVLAYDGSKK